MHIVGAIHHAPSGNPGQQATHRTVGQDWHHDAPRSLAIIGHQSLGQRVAGIQPIFDWDRVGHDPGRPRSLDTVIGSRVSASSIRA